MPDDVSRYRRWTAGRSLPRLLRKVPDRIARDLGRTHPDWFYGGRVLDLAASSSILSSLIQGEDPFVAARLGATEQAVLARHLIYESSSTAIGLMRRTSTKYPRHIRDDISALSGVSPPTDANLDEFCRRYIQLLPHIDVLGVWHHLTEMALVRRHLVDAQLVPLRALDPITGPTDWLQSLAGKRVCVVHPFAKTIEGQYRKRETLFTEPLLPEFDLVTVQAVQALGQLPSEHASWFAALASMHELVISSGADIVLVGAGAFGLPLAVMAKNEGLKALHLGGSLQLIFGIMGTRWERNEMVLRLATPNWVRPSSSERPSSADSVENACYW